MRTLKQLKTDLAKIEAQMMRLEALQRTGKNVRAKLSDLRDSRAALTRAIVGDAALRALEASIVGCVDSHDAEEA